MKAITQTIFLLAICVAIGLWLGPLYLIFSGLTVITIFTVCVVWGWGWSIVRDATALLGLGLVWPVVMLAFIAYRGGASARVAQTLRSPTRSAESDVLRIEDFQKRE